jgi:hypothetical protein
MNYEFGVTSSAITCERISAVMRSNDLAETVKAKGVRAHARRQLAILEDQILRQKLEK